MTSPETSQSLDGMRRRRVGLVSVRNLAHEVGVDSPAALPVSTSARIF